MGTTLIASMTDSLWGETMTMLHETTTKVELIDFHNPFEF